MPEYNSHLYWPSSEELPDSDDTPVDNELQDLIPGMLKAILAMAWADRMDWFFGVHMGIYYDPNKPPLVPDGFLSLGVERFFDEELRLSYALWEENIAPIMVLEVVSQTYRGEYSEKKNQYAELGFLYYVIYSPRRRRKPHLEVHRLVNGKYELQPGNPVWLPEIGLGIGAQRGTYQGITREWLYWYSEQTRLLTPEEHAQFEQQRRSKAEQRRSEAEQRRSEAEQRRSEAEQRRSEAEQRAQMLEAHLRSLGIDPETLT